MSSRKLKSDPHTYEDVEPYSLSNANYSQTHINSISSIIVSKSLQAIFYLFQIVCINVEENLKS